MTGQINLNYAAELSNNWGPPLVRRSYVGDDPEMIRKKMQATVTKLPT